MQIPGISDIVVWVRSAREAMAPFLASVRWFVTKMAPVFAIPVFFAISITEILTSEDLWNSFQYIMSLVESNSLTAGAGASPWLSKINYVVPLQEAFIMTLGLIQLQIACWAARILKALLEFVLEVIPF